MMRTYAFRFAVVVATLLVLTYAAPARAFDPAVAFTTRCSGCHSVGKGDVVGPDLRNVLLRHDRNWLHSFIRSSQSVIRAGDAKAMALFHKYGGRRMPDHNLSIPEIDRLLDLIAAGGPRDAGASSIRSAATAGLLDVSRGRDLFLGRLAFHAGGAACVQCHVAGEANLWGGGSLSDDLTRAYARYQEWGLDRALAHPRSPLMASIYDGRPLTADEVFAIKAFLRQTAHSAPLPARSGSPFVFLLGFGSSALAVWLTGRGPRGSA